MNFENIPINTDPLRRYSYESGPTRELVDDLIKGYGITPSTHRHMVDLAAGDGSIAALFYEHGWSQQDLTCIDLCVSPTPLVRNAMWIYQDLFALANILSSHEGIVPQQISKLKASFDIISIYQSPLHSWEEEIISRYLARNSHTFILAASHVGYIK